MRAYSSKIEARIRRTSTRSDEAVNWPAETVRGVQESTALAQTIFTFDSDIEAPETETNNRKEADADEGKFKVTFESAMSPEAVETLRKSPEVTTDDVIVGGASGEEKPRILTGREMDCKVAQSCTPDNKKMFALSIAMETACETEKSERASSGTRY